MADVTIAEGGIGTALVTLEADTIYEIAFSEDLDTVTVISDGAAEIWWTCDGTDPDATTGSGWYMPGFKTIDQRDVPTGTATTVKLLSSGTPVVRVQRA